MDESLQTAGLLQPNGAFQEILASAVARPTEVTLRQLLECFPQHADVFLIDRVKAIAKLLDVYCLEAIPDVSDGDLETVRLLGLRKVSPLGFAGILSQAADGESASLEFKSSFEFDHKKAKHAPDTPVKELQSASVRWTFLKTIAAFLNTDGGILLAGVNDEGECIGIQYEFPFLKAGHQNGDGWQLHVRDVIGSSFHQGTSIRDYIRISVAQHTDGRMIARVEVTARRRLSFLIDPQKKYFIYRRQGNLTHEVQLQDIEEFLERRWGLPK